MKVAFASGTSDLNPLLVERLAALYPDLPLYVVAEFAPSRGTWIPYHPYRSLRENLAACRAALAGRRVRLAAVLLVPQTPYRRMRLMALLLSARGFLAYNENLDSFMLRPRSLPAILRHVFWRMSNFVRWQARPDHPWRVRPLLERRAAAAKAMGVFAGALRPGTTQRKSAPALRASAALPPETPAALRSAFAQIPDLFCATTRHKAVWIEDAPDGVPLRWVQPLRGESGSYVLYGCSACSLFDAEKLRALGGGSAASNRDPLDDLVLGYRAWLRGWPTVLVGGELLQGCPNALGDIPPEGYLHFAAAMNSPGLWLAAVRRLQATGAEEALAGAWKLPWTAKKLGPIHPEIFALSDVSVFPGIAATGKPVVLIASAYLPFPLAHGGAVRMFQLMSRAAADFHLVLVAFHEEPHAPPAELLSFCTEIVLVKRRGTHYRKTSELPNMVEELDTPAFHIALQQTLHKWHPGLVQLEFTPMARYAADCGRTPKILVEHDITYDLHEQLVKGNPDWEARRQLEKWRHFETAAWSRVDRVVTMSEKDRAVVGGARATCLPNGVDLRYYQASAQEPEPGRVLFIGSFTHLPNLLAMEFFLADVWPRLDDLTPVLHVIAGARHEYYMEFHRKRVEGPRVQVEGFVKDVRGAYARASVVIAPLVASAGTNIKILEAMAMGKAIVSTPAGINGLDVEGGVLVETAADAFACAVRLCLRDRAERERLGRTARAIVEKNFGWDAIAGKQRALYRELVAPGVSSLERPSAL